MSNNTYAADGSLNVTVVGGSTSTTTAADAADGDNTSLIANTKFVQRAVALLKAAANVWAAVQTFTLAPVFTDASGTRTALGLGALSTVTPGTGVATLLAGTSSGTGGPAGTASPTFSGTVNVASLIGTGSASGFTSQTAISTGFLGFASRGGIVAPSDGVIKLRNNGDTDFSRLQFGGTTSSFPSLKRNSTAINARLADDSADAPLTAAAITASGQLIGVGTATNDSAAAGVIGEYITSDIASGSAINLTTNTPANLTSISLTAGDWEVSCNMFFSVASGPVVSTGLIASVSTTSATLDSSIGERWAQLQSGLTAIGSLKVTTRVSIASTTTIYGVGRAIFSSGTPAMFGQLNARRVR